MTVSPYGDLEFESVSVHLDPVGWNKPVQFGVDTQLPTERLLVDIELTPSLTSTDSAKSQDWETIPALVVIVSDSLPLSVRTQDAPVTHVGVAAAGATSERGLRPVR